MRFHKLDLNLLVVLDALLATRSVSKSAERLFLSQPATSLALGRLRDYFKDELLVSVGKTLVPTPLANELAKPVRDVLLQIQTIAHARPSFDPATSQRRFTIESSDYVISVLLTQVVRRAATLAPLMQFDLRAISPQTPEHLDSGEAELLIAPEFAKVAGHPFEPLFEDGFSCLVCADSPLLDGPLTPARYFDAAHIGVEWGGGRRTTFDARLMSTGKRSRRQEVIAPNFTLLPELLVGTQRIATLPTRLAQHMARRFALQVLQCPVEIPRFTELLQWHKHQERDPAIAWLRSLIRDAGASLDRLAPDVGH
ncbi:LysR family transcriptional regulator [Delftia sp. WSY_4]|uniref:LysR family transcriptional regulator n=1 Tax=Delftia TaxID=80865 RepID=UPI0006419E60|nr:MULTISPECIES: LysR family transcriptional regulator [Delftia]KLO61691.1 LysR family transcriptional regulator [Delftia tsuruhatensis]MDH0422691.1 LysR family transcriptional regulator [Delftia tsuruhatensis]OJX17383.1 MAG: LysR family transcriptional regulator [Delftia sp. 67-8]WON88249.1 LysR family transcriptional regulator [Delftia sp. UGAL515B_04]